jgi:molybdate transport system substrate-binding protein
VRARLVHARHSKWAFQIIWEVDNMSRRNILSVSATLVLGLALLGIAGGIAASAAEIKLLSASALHPAIDALIPDFEKSSGHRIAVDYGTAGAVADRVQKGEAADIIISSVPMIDRLQAQGKIVAGERAAFAKVGVGAFVRKGAAKPDISSPDAFKRTMLGRKVDCLSRSSRWGCQRHLRGRLARTTGYRRGNETQD